MNQHLKNARERIGWAKSGRADLRPTSQDHAQIAIAEALTGILELLDFWANGPE